MCKAISDFWPGFIPPSIHELRTWILKAEVDDIDKMIEEHKTTWKQYGCSIMSNNWTDDTIKNGELLCNYLSTVIDEVGEENVMQIISDNGSNYVNAGKRLMEKYKSLYWTPCAAHCIDFLLEDIEKLKVHQETLAKAKQVVKFIYVHTLVLDLMRSFTKNHELLRPAVTRFDTFYLTLQSIYKQKQALQSMFSSEHWNSSVWARKPEGVKSQSTVMYDRLFWGDVKYCILSVIPLKYMPIWNKINARWMPQLHRPLHAVGYYLNPQVRFEDRFSSAEVVNDGLYECMDRMLNYRDRLKADVQLDQYNNATGEFGTRIAIDSRKLRSPANWWIRFGSKTSELTKFAIRELSLTCSSSGCERNWSSFERIHTKKRNRLEHKKLNALAYVMYNTRLQERSIRRKSQDADPIVVEEVESDDEWITEQEDPILSNDASWLNDENLFDVEVIRHILATEYDGEGCSRPNISSDACASSTRPQKKTRTSEASSSLRPQNIGERHEARMTLDEDGGEDLKDNFGRRANGETNHHGGATQVGLEVGMNNEGDRLDDYTYDSG